MRLSGIFQYPIKSCRGFASESVEVLERGFPQDRRWMLVDSTGRFISQRETPALSLVSPEVTEDGLRVSVADHPELIIAGRPVAETDLNVQVWNSEFPAIDAGDKAADWFSAYLGQKVRLVHMTENVQRVRSSSVTGEKFEVSFADGYPYLLTNTASLSDLNSRMAEPVPMDRFRANLVIETDTPFAEDNWKRIQIGSVKFRVVKACSRCTITTIEQETAIKGQEPLRTLNTFRRFGNQVNFGMNLIAAGSGSVKLGDKLKIIR